MTSNFSLKCIAALAAVACLSTSAMAQVSIRVEESTSSVSRRGEAAPIDIQLPRPAAPKVVLTTSTENRSADPTPSGSSIDLTPAEFRAQQTPEPTPAPTATPTPEIVQPPPPGAPSGIPVPTPSPVPDETPSTDDTDQAPSLTEGATTVGESAEIDPAAASATTDEEAPFLPPAELANQKMLTRGGVEVPLRPEQLTSAPLDVTVPDVFQTTLTNGIKFYHYENHDLPRIRVTMLIEAGKNADPEDKVGLAELTARTMRSGGAAGKSGDEIDQQLEQIGSDLEFKVDLDHVSGQLFALTEKSSEAMSLLADVLIRPEFDQKKFDQQRDRALEELRRQNDQPADISRREFRKIVYGPEHPLARTPTSSTITSITRDDVRAFHEARYRPSTLWIGISGDISQDEARKLVETAFASWDRPPAEEVTTLTAVSDSDSTPGVYFTKRPTAQSQIRIGHLGIERKSPKAYAVNVLNSIYGTGGFSSRLMNQVRTKHGYAYGVGGGIFSDEPVGLFAAIAASQAGTTAAAIKEMLSVTRDIIEGPISEAEVETARRDIIFSFVTQFNTPHETIATHMIHDYRGYDDDYLETFPGKVRAITVDDVKQVARDLIKPENLKIYVIGNEAELDQPLESFGPVTEWSVEDYSGTE